MDASGKGSYGVSPSSPSSPLQGGAVTIYGVYLGGGIYDASCTTAQCFYVVSVASTSYVISVASVNKDGDVGPNSIPTIYGKWSDGLKNTVAL